MINALDRRELRTPVCAASVLLRHQPSVFWTRSKQSRNNRAETTTHSISASVDPELRAASPRLSAVCQPAPGRDLRPLGVRVGEFAAKGAKPSAPSQRPLRPHLPNLQRAGLCLMETHIAGDLSPVGNPRTRMAEIDSRSPGARNHGFGPAKGRVFFSCATRPYQHQLGALSVLFVAHSLLNNEHGERITG